MFRDELTVEVEGGRGGDGLVSFRREAKLPKGGPDGGDGGRGGDVVLVARGDLNSLLELGRRPRYGARNGQPGGPQTKTGRGAEDLELEVPVGTQVFDAERGNLLFDLTEPGQRLVVAAGGIGGRGNKHFASAVRQTPRHAGLGRPGEARTIRLELRMVAEVGLVGLPNAGKSTFLARVTAARPKIADYPFTTLEPEVGIATVGDYDTLLIADLPGLIEGASEGTGLGDRFLRHVERCPVLIQMVDVSAGATTPPDEAFRVIDAELLQSSPVLHAKPRLVVGSKCEGEGDEERLGALAEAAGEARETNPALRLPVLALSSATGRGIGEVLRGARQEVRGLDV
jgi:GTP-binding protein